MHCSFGWSICQKFTVVGEFLDLEECLFNLMINMWHSGLSEIHSNSQIANSFWRIYSGLSNLNAVLAYRWVKFWAEYHHFSFRVIEFWYVIRVPITEVINRSFNYLKLVYIRCFEIVYNWDLSANIWKGIPCLWPLDCVAQRQHVGGE